MYFLCNIFTRHGPVKSCEYNNLLKNFQKSENWLVQTREKTTFSYNVLKNLNFLFFRFPKAVTKPFKLSDVEQTKLFLMWMRLGTPLRALSVWFSVSHGLVSDTLDRVKKLLLANVVPYHLGFGPKHNLTLDLVKNSLSTWISREIGQTVFDGHDVLLVADGTYIYCMSIGDFEGQKALYSGHKKRCLLKVRNRFKFLDVSVGCNKPGFKKWKTCMFKVVSQMLQKRVT